MFGMIVNKMPATQASNAPWPRTLDIQLPDSHIGRSVYSFFESKRFEHVTLGCQRSESIEIGISSKCELGRGTIGLLVEIVQRVRRANLRALEPAEGLLCHICVCCSLQC
jgi:hypothetical protein